MSSARIIKVNDNEQYSLGDSLGRGAFGHVFRGLNTQSGETVAVKQIKLKNIAEAEAREIMTEIDLLKNLHHPNIVKYHSFHKTNDSLYIVLEYCENGSLASICKSFGVFPEHLVAVYTNQVLLGLIYLHEQGVIHRDIKGANILTTKDGVVKLADFGVATNVLSEMTVVGSPYWMAPEIIELAGATSASDIWSLGCVIIELLQGRPPYCDMDQMSAMFHIVDDEHPPFPDGASAGARDFLVRCFQKDPNLRTSAKKLRQHSWILNHVKTGSQKSSNSSKTKRLDFDDAVTSVQEYNEKVNGPDLVHRSGKSHAPTQRHSKIAHAGSQSRRPPVLIQKHFEDHSDDWSKDLVLEHDQSLIRMPLKLKKPAQPSTRTSKVDETNWDDDFVGESDILRSRPSRGILPSRTQLKSTTESPSSLSRSDLQPPPNGSAVPRRRSPQRTILGDETIRPSSAQLARSMTQSPPGTPTSRRVQRGHSLLKSSSVSDLTPKRMQRSASAGGQGHFRKSVLALQQYADNEEEDYSDIIVDEIRPATPILGVKLNSLEYASNKSWLQDDDGGGTEDPFADIEEFEKENLTANVLREQKARLVHHMEQALRQFQACHQNDMELLPHIKVIKELLTEHSDLKATVISAHGLLPLLETLESSTEDELSLTILEVLNFLAFDNEEVQENITFVGGISSITKFAYKTYNQDIRTQAAIFVRQILASSDLNAQMFVGCRGLGILTELLEEDYYEEKTLVTAGIEGIARVFSLQGKYTPRNDLCRILARTGVLEPLMHTLHVLNCGETEEEGARMISSILAIMLNFAQADEYTKKLIATRTVLKRLMMDLNMMSPEHLVAALKFIKSLSSVTSTLEILHNANAIECLIKLLSNTSKPSYQEIANHILTTLFNLCRIDKARQYEAATVGLIPILKRIVANNRPLKDMALPMLCNMAHNKDCRRLLWSQNGLEFYLTVLVDPFWQVNAFEAIVVWFFEEAARVEKKLIEPASIRALISAFASARGIHFESLLDQFQKLLKASRRVSRALDVPDFMFQLLERMKHSKPTVRANLLKVLQSILDVCPHKEETLLRYDITKVLKYLSEKDTAIIVKTLAGSMLHAVNVQYSTEEPYFDAKEQQSWEGKAKYSSKRAYPSHNPL